jgi:hypothetical protein
VEAMYTPLLRLGQYWTAHGVAIRSTGPLSHARAGDDQSI